MKSFLNLTKSGIVCFVLISGLAGFALSTQPHEPWNFVRLSWTLLALYFFSAGSFAINQAQEWLIDKEMPRTVNRPIPSGKISLDQAWTVGVGFVVLGVLSGAKVNPLIVLLGLLTVILYNGLYTLYWKRHLAFGAVPGAIPGAMPVVIGYAANTSNLLQADLIYAFLIMFLWQMPHFWTLAIRFKDDYSKGGIPVLPLILGTGRTLVHIGIYMFAYVILAISSPWFTTAHWVYIFVVVPFALKVFYEFYRYYKAGAEKRWLPFFLWTNFSVLVFLIAPVLDRWYRLYYLTPES
jgi:protoheme IX farnesyltransferase